MRCYPVPSSSCNLCTYKSWSCYVHSFRSKCIYKKIQYLSCNLDLVVKITDVTQYPLHHVTFEHTQFEVAPSKGWGGDVFTKIQYLTFDLGLGAKVTKKCSPIPSTSCNLCTYKSWSCYVHRFRSKWIYKKIQYLSCDLVLIITGVVTQYPLHHVTFAHTKFEVATSKGWGGDEFTKKI